MRDCVEAIIQYNAGFDKPSLRAKLQRMSLSPFAFFRATHHLFAADMKSGPFQRLAIAPSNGRIVADLHTENFGGFRSASGMLAYDINDFDDSTEGLYEYDLRRLLTSIVLGGTESGLRLGATVNACETAADSYLRAIGTFAAATKRSDLLNLHDPQMVRKLLNVASERSHGQFIKVLAEPRPKGGYQFMNGVNGLGPLNGRIREEAETRFPAFLGHCEAPAGVQLKGSALEDVVFRYAGKGSLGKKRYALLMREAGTDSEEALRVLEWKESTDSPLALREPSKRKQSRNRNREVFAAALAFQLHPQRYIGYLWMFGVPMQAREMGANDCRFDHLQYADPAKLEKAAEVFGGITARAHLLASLGQAGPRKLIKESGVTPDRFAGRLAAFATAYANCVHEDFAEFKKRHSEVAKAWKAA